MGIGKALKYHGNINRIMEMHAGNMGPCAIAGTFCDHGIDITAQQVSNIISSYSALTSKALPKSVAHDAINTTVVAFAVA